jgi:putative two-component system response regulator
MTDAEGDRSLLNCRILVVDDEPANVNALLRLLGRAGYGDVEGITDPRQAMPSFRAHPSDLVLLDLRMPHLDGFDLLDLLRKEVSDDEYLPVLVLTGDLSQETREKALAAGARDFITKPFDLTEVLLRIKNLLEARVLHLQLQEHNRTLEKRVRERTRELAVAQVEILHRLALAAEYRDDVTGRHAERVGALASLLAERLGREKDEIRLLRRAATLHDVGKIGVPDGILMKPGRLTPGEWDRMRAHVEIGERILMGSGYPILEMAAEIARFHHERWDGEGYQNGLKGDDIPLSGRLVAVADVFDSLTHIRPYKEAQPVEEAVTYIANERGAHFDPAVVDAFLELAEEGILHRLDELVREGRDLWSGEVVPGLDPGE